MWKGNVFTKVCQEFCPKGGCVCVRDVCVGDMHGRGRAWQGGMCGRGVCMAGGDMCGRGVHGGTCIVGGHAWQGSVHGGEGGGRRARQQRRPLQRTVRILLECILVQLITFPFDDKFHLTQFVIHVFTRRTWNGTLRHMVFPVHFCCNNCNHCFGSRG